MKSKSFAISLLALLALGTITAADLSASAPVSLPGKFVAASSVSTPEPTTLCLLAPALGLIFFGAWRRYGKVALSRARNKRVRAVSVLPFMFASTYIADASTIYNNLNSTSGGQDSVSTFGPLADSFSTGSSGFTLGSVAVKLLATKPGDGGSITVQLLSNNPSSPNSAYPETVLDLIGTVSDSSLSTSLADYTLDLTTPYSLTANTRYWIELSTTNNSSADWSWSFDQTAQGVAGEYNFNSSGVSPNSAGPYQMELSNSTAAAPEPATLSLLASALALIAFGTSKRSRRLRSYSSVMACTVLALLAGRLKADTIISAQFENNAGIFVPAVNFSGVEPDAAAADPAFAASNVWNHLQNADFNPGPLSFSNLLNSTGANTGASLSISWETGAINTGTGKFPSDYFFNTTLSDTVTLAGLPSNQPFTLFLYVYTPSKFTIGSSSFDSANGKPSSEDPGVTVGFLTGTTSSTGTIEMTQVATPNNVDGETDWSGFQLDIGRAVTSAPEPTTLPLLAAGLGLILFGTIQKRNNRTAIAGE